MAKKTHFYEIYVFVDGKLKPYDGIEYTAKEVQPIISNLRKSAPEFKPCLKYRGWKYTVNFSVNHLK